MARLEELVVSGPAAGDAGNALESLRRYILENGVQSSNDGTVEDHRVKFSIGASEANIQAQSEIRIYIWLILLNSPPIRTDVYLDLVRQGASPAYAKIRNDTFRTLTTDPLFKRRVTENSLTRVLNAMAWKMHDAHEARLNGWQSPPAMSVGSPDVPLQSPLNFMALRGDRPNGGRESLTGTTLISEGSEAGGVVDNPSCYVQGMNVLAAPFLYVARSESEAFVAFEHLITYECPGYVRGTMEGVHRGLALVDEVLAIVDPQLAQYLLSKGMKAEIYAFASVLTLCACTPPLPEVLQLWDFLFAYGTHLNILCIVAQLVLIRDQILKSPSPNQVLRPFPNLQAEKIKAIAVSFVQKIPEELYDRLIGHAK